MGIALIADFTIPRYKSIVISEKIIIKNKDKHSEIFTLKANIHYSSPI